MVGSGDRGEGREERHSVVFGDQGLCNIWHKRKRQVSAFRKSCSELSYKTDSHLCQLFFCVS